MKNQIVKVVTSLSFFALLCTVAHAQAAHQPLRAHVPFAFAVGNDEMPAGDYLVSIADASSGAQTVQIKSADGRASRLLQMNHVGGGEVREGGRLVFRRFGSYYFLSQVWEPAESTGLSLRRSRAEREVELAAGRSGAVTNVQVALGK